ncbi:MAG TPA: DUF378 domain-containing protein [Rhabdochlamydiaceae bacterium]|nr:DUF378 domain-containing protein [Rhabdochlamydiaceae bacterium]
MKLDAIIELLLVIGGLNLGIMAAFDTNMIEMFFGYRSPLTFIVYGLIGIAAAVRVIRFVARKTR